LAGSRNFEEAEAEMMLMFSMFAGLSRGDLMDMTVSEILAVGKVLKKHENMLKSMFMFRQLRGIASVR